MKREKLSLIIFCCVALSCCTKLEDRHVCVVEPIFDDQKISWYRYQYEHLFYEPIAKYKSIVSREGVCYDVFQKYAPSATEFIRPVIPSIDENVYYSLVQHWKDSVSSIFPLILDYDEYSDNRGIDYNSFDRSLTYGLDSIKTIIQHFNDDVEAFDGFLSCHQAYESVYSNINNIVSTLDHESSLSFNILEYSFDNIIRTWCVNNKTIFPKIVSYQEYLSLLHLHIESIQQILKFFITRYTYENKYYNNKTSLDSYTKQVVENDPDNPNNKYMAFSVDEYIPFSNGYLGYVDLGLSYKWAVNNIGSIIQKDDMKNFSDFFQIPQPLDISEPLWPNININTFPVEPNITNEPKKIIDSYALFIKEYNDCLDLYCNRVADYANQCNEYHTSFENAKNDYYINLLNNKFSYLSTYGGYVAWGTNHVTEQYFVSRDNSSIPDNFSGMQEYDAATSTWGVEWLTPTKEQMLELVENCTWTFISIGSLNGVKITGPSGKSIFLPTVFHQTANFPRNFEGETYGYYLTSNKSPKNSYSAYILHIVKSSAYIGDSDEYWYGVSLRPIRGI